MVIGRELNAKLFAFFRETHPDLPPLNEGTISKIDAHYREMGHVRKVPSKRQAVVDDTKLEFVACSRRKSNYSIPSTGP
ncbi:hypothetical protein NQ318_001044 [Aromia moschata]|uniref:DUF4817 domain-containing protein n=1 Tax=Aromia moschata TaxID=1265417 RepID=A0AAV8ZE23_9CUCU|nr:hypothetical protein NQ318_001044 [Aromia moschata]